MSDYEYFANKVYIVADDEATGSIEDKIKIITTDKDTAFSFCQEHENNLLGSGALSVYEISPDYNHVSMEKIQ